MLSFFSALFVWPWAMMDLVEKAAALAVVAANAAVVAAVVPERCGTFKERETDALSAFLYMHNLGDERSVSAEASAVPFLAFLIIRVLPKPVLQMPTFMCATWF